MAVSVTYSTGEVTSKKTFDNAFDWRVGRNGGLVLMDQRVALIAPHMWILAERV